MSSVARLFSLTVPFMAAAAVAATAAKVPTYVLNGYSFSGVPGVNAAEMEAKMKDHAGAHVTGADIKLDTAILTKALEARHIKGQLLTTLAEEKGRVWVIFDVVDLQGARPMGRLEVQNFEGASRVSAAVLSVATNLKKGDQLSPEKLRAARRAITTAYAQSMPGKTVFVKTRLKMKPGGETDLTWIIGEPK